MQKLIERPKVTIAIGLVSRGKEPRQNEIIFASDSQTTFEDGEKAFDGAKINTIQFKNGSILTAHSGSRDVAEKAVDLIRKAAVGVSIDSKDTVMNLVQSTLRKMRREQIDLNNRPEFDQKHFFHSEFPFRMLFGFYCNGEPCLFRVDWDLCYARQSQRQFEAIGVGKDLASFLLNEYQAADPNFEFGQIISIAVIKKVIENVEACGGPIQYGIVFPNNEPGRMSTAFTLPPEHTELVSRHLAKEDAALSKYQRAHMMKIVKNIWESDVLLWKNLESEKEKFAVQPPRALR